MRSLRNKPPLAPLVQIRTRRRLTLIVSARGLPTVLHKLEPEA